MKITAEQRGALTPHVTSTDFKPTPMRAPSDVDKTLAALIDTGDIKGSHVRYRPLRKTHWSVWVATATQLANVEVDYDVDDYDSEAEEKEGKRARFTSSWARPLSTLRKLQFQNFIQGQADDRGEFYFQGVRLFFEDEEQPVVFENLPFPADAADRARWDKFIGAIRDGSPLLTVELMPEVTSSVLDGVPE